MNVYIAAPLSSAVRACDVADSFMGLHDAPTVVSRWHRECAALGLTIDPPTDEECLAALKKNDEDLWRADVVLALLDAGNGRETYAEIGIATERGLPVLWIHHRRIGRSLRDAHPRVMRIDSDQFGRLMPAERAGLLREWSQLGRAA